MCIVYVNCIRQYCGVVGRLNRNHSDLLSDVELLVDHHIVYFVREGRAKRAVIPYEDVRIDLRIRGDTDPASP